MVSERIQRRIDRLLDQAEEAMDQLNWDSVRDCAQAVLGLDPQNIDALAFLASVDRVLKNHPDSKIQETSAQAVPISHPTDQPTSFANGRYQVKKFLGEGGKKKVYPSPGYLAGSGGSFRPHQD